MRGFNDFLSTKCYFSSFLPSRPKIGRHIMHQTSWPRYDPTPGGSNKAAEVKVSIWALSVQLKTSELRFDVTLFYFIFCPLQVVSKECPAPSCVSLDLVATWDTWVPVGADKAHEVIIHGDLKSCRAFLHIALIKQVNSIYFFFSSRTATSQAMAPRPSMGVSGPRSMPPYKYATSVRNPNPQVVQTIPLQQV